MVKKKERKLALDLSERHGSTAALRSFVRASALGFQRVCSAVALMTLSLADWKKTALLVLPV